MDVVLQSKGLLSLPAYPKTSGLLLSRGLSRRANLSIKPKLFGQSSLSGNGFKKFLGFLPKTRGFGQRETVSLICRAEAAAAAAADGQPVFKGIKNPEFFGIELTTLKKIVPLGMMFFCILFNYTILRDTKDFLVVTA